MAKGKGPRVNVLWSQETRQVLYIEAGKDFVDLLLSILRMPTAAVLRLIIGEKLTGVGEDAYAGVVNLLHALNNLESSVLQVPKEALTAPPMSLGVDLLRLASGPAGGTDLVDTVYRCPELGSNSAHYSRYDGQRCGTSVWRKAGRCPDCDRTLVALRLRENDEPNGGDGGDDLEEEEDCERNENEGGGKANASGYAPGFVKENITFMITDDLDFFQASTIKSIAILNDLGVENMSELRNTELEVDRSLAVALIKASLTTTSVLNEVFGSKLHAKSPSRPRKRKGE